MKEGYRQKYRLVVEVSEYFKSYFVLLVLSKPFVLAVFLVPSLNTPSRLNTATKAKLL